MIRTGRIEDSTTLVARPLARYRWMVLASPAWLAAHGRPQSIDELHQHRAVGYLNHRTGRTIDWLFSLDEGDCAIRMRETLVVDDTDAYIQAGIQGAGPDPRRQLSGATLSAERGAGRLSGAGRF